MPYHRVRGKDETMWESSGSVVVTFENMPGACAMEDAARQHGIPGRLAPIPSAVSAGCGMAWVAPATDAEAVRAALADYGIAHEGVFDIPA